MNRSGHSSFQVSYERSLVSHEHPGGKHSLRGPGTVGPGPHRAAIVFLRTVPARGADVLVRPEKVFDLVGMKSYGCAPTFLLLTFGILKSGVPRLVSGDGFSGIRIDDGA